MNRLIVSPEQILADIARRGGTVETTPAGAVLPYNSVEYHRLNNAGVNPDTAETITRILRGRRRSHGKDVDGVRAMNARASLRAATPSGIGRAHKATVAA